MAYTQKDNSGSLFRNDRKEKDTHPDHKGSAMIDGTEYWVSAWVKEAGGKRFFSLAFKPKEERIKNGVREGGEPAVGMDSEIPF